MSDKPRFDFSAFPRLQTERLVLREMTSHDIPHLYAIFSDPEVTRFIGVDTCASHHDAIWMLNLSRNLYATHEGLRWAIARREDERRLIGTCGYNAWTRHNNCAEVGYDLAHAWWGHGLITEAMRAVLRFGFLMMALNRVEADVTVGNDDSLRVLRRLGFQQEGLLRKKGFWKGSYHDLLLFSLLREEYTAAAGLDASPTTR